MMRLAGCPGAVSAGSLFGELCFQKIKEGSGFRTAAGAAVGHAHQEHQRLEHFGIAQPGIAGVLLLGFAVLLDHVLQLGADRLLRGALGRLVIVQAGIHQAFVVAGERREAGNQVAIVDGRGRQSHFSQRHNLDP